MYAIVRPTPRLRRTQSGYALLMIVVLLVLGSVYALTLKLDAVALRQERDRKTALALAQAKDALIGYAISNSLPGQFPCPDVNNDGATDTAGSTDCTVDSVGNRDRGHLPWKTLGLGDIRDGDGECLWYALATNSTYRAQPAAFRTGHPLNTGTPGGITIKDSTGNIIGSHIVAIIFSPGNPIRNQMRTASTASPCGGGAITEYLDTGPAPAFVNNATGASSDTYVSAPRTTDFNDTLITITEHDIAVALARRVISEIRGYDYTGLGGGSSGLIGYYKSTGIPLSTLPCAAIAPTSPALPTGIPSSSSTGLFPYSAAFTFSTTTKNWLKSDNWNLYVSYSLSTPCSPANAGPVTATITLPSPASEPSFPITFTTNFP